MAGPRITLELQTGEVSAALGRLAAFGDRALEPALGAIGEYLVRATRERAAREVSPDGTPWQALSPRYQRRKDKKRPGAPKLKFDFHMLGDQLSHQVVGNELLVGTNAKYGAIHQFGGEVKVHARSQFAYFRHDREGGLAPRFVKKSKATFAQPVTLPEHTITMPARPWLGLSREDETEVLAILADHLARQLGPEGAAGE